ncbi:hypothetical protein OBRU01_04681, partial [Operophtera brumata]
MANDTPESDFSIECFQNYSAPEVFVQGLAGMVDQTDVETIIRAQKNISQYPEAYKAAVATSSTTRRPVDEDDEFKPSEGQPVSKMVATVSTETLKPATSETKKSKKKEIK